MDAFVLATTGRIEPLRRLLAIMTDEQVGAHVAAAQLLAHYATTELADRERRQRDFPFDFNDNRVALRPPERESQMRYALPDPRGFVQEQAAEWSDPKPRSCPTCQSIGTPRVVSRIGEPFRLCSDPWHTS